jgi:hypothetical protein
MHAAGHGDGAAVNDSVYDQGRSNTRHRSRLRSRQLGHFTLTQWHCDPERCGMAADDALEAHTIRRLEERTRLTVRVFTATVRGSTRF